jgi:hypothetical protein
MKIQSRLDEGFVCFICLHQMFIHVTRIDTEFIPFVSIWFLRGCIQKFPD